MKNYFVGGCLVAVALIYAFTERYSTIEQNIRDIDFLVRYDSWSHELCTLGDTKSTRRLISMDYIPPLCSSN